MRSRATFTMWYWHPTRALVLAWALIALNAGCAREHKRSDRTADASAASARSVEHFVFTSFRHDDPGLYLLHSTDGRHWERVAGGEPLLVLEGERRLRDPFVVRGDDGVYHLLFTGGGPTALGYASSRNLIDWSAARYVDVMGSVPGCRNVWAPEAIFDERAVHWLVFWSSSVDGMFEATARSDFDMDHRIWAATTHDFVEFSQPFLLWDPGHNVIDMTFFRKDGRLWVFYKNEQEKPTRAKRIGLAEARSVTGPFVIVQPRTTWAKLVEAPSAIEIGERVIVYYDWYREGRYGAMSSLDMRSWQERSGWVRFPQGHRHGTVLRVPDEIGVALVTMGPRAGTIGRDEPVP